MIFTGLDDLSFLDHVNAIGVDDCGRAVRDDHAGMSGVAGDALGDDGLSQVVACAGGLVEHQDARAADLAEVQGRQLATIVGDRADNRVSNPSESRMIVDFPEPEEPMMDLKPRNHR